MMKYLLCVLIFPIFFSCSDNEADVDQDQKSRSVKSESDDLFTHGEEIQQLRDSLYSKLYIRFN